MCSRQQGVKGQQEAPLVGQWPLVIAGGVWRRLVRATPVIRIHPSLSEARGRLKPVEQELAGEGRSTGMAQTNQAWDWGVELRDEERSELELLRETVAQLRRQLDRAHESLRSSRRRKQDASRALRELDEAKPWRRRRVRAGLRIRGLL
jgi:hypothetical protein